MDYVEVFSRILKENIFKDQGYELIQNNIYGKDGVMILETSQEGILDKEVYEIINDSSNLEEYIKETQAFQALKNFQIKPSLFGEDKNLLFLKYNDGSARVIKSDNDKKQWNIYKKLFLFDNGKSSDFKTWKNK